jgi:hypothetical protein
LFPLRCAVRFWSSESETEFVYVFIVFFLLLCVLGLSPFTKKPAEPGGQRRSPSASQTPVVSEEGSNLRWVAFAEFVRAQLLGRAESLRLIFDFGFVLFS